MPKKFSEEKVKTIISAVERGIHPETAAIASGVCKRTFFYWMSKGRQGIEPYADFHEAVRQAEARAELKIFDELRAAQDNLGQSDPKQLQFILERRFRGRWTKQVKIEVEIRLQNILDQVEVYMSEGSYAELIDAISEVQGQARTLKRGQHESDLPMLMMSKDIEKEPI